MSPSMRSDRKTRFSSRTNLADAHKSANGLIEATRIRRQMHFVARQSWPPGLIVD